MRRFVLSLILVGVTLLPAGCYQPSVLSTISCPVYDRQAGETPHPEWPKVCGGQR